MINSGIICLRVFNDKTEVIMERLSMSIHAIAQLRTHGTKIHRPLDDIGIAVKDTLVKDGNTLSIDTDFGAWSRMGSTGLRNHLECF
jgi:hypothetical protein